MTKTTASEIDAAILNGMDYRTFQETHPDVRYKRWKDRKSLLRMEGKLPPASPERLVEIIEEEGVKAVAVAERESLELKQARRTINELKRELANMYDVVESLKDGFSNLPPLHANPPKPDTGNKPKATVILPLFDVHIGHNLNGIDPSTGTDIFLLRCKTFSESLQRDLIGLKKARNVERLVVILGGDIIEGRTIYPGQPKESLPIQYQLCTGPEIMATQLLAPLARLFPDVSVFSIPGNHGRLGEKNELLKVADNLDMVFCHILEMRCKNIKHMKWYEQEDAFALFQIYDHTYLAAHGDGFKSWGGNPTNAAVRYKDRVQDMKRTHLDVLIVGHHHTNAELMRGFSRVCMVNNWIGTTEYSASMGLGGPPSQKVLIADEQNPVFMTMEYLLEDGAYVVPSSPIRLDGD